MTALKHKDRGRNDGLLQLLFGGDQHRIRHRPGQCVGSLHESISFSSQNEAMGQIMTLALLCTGGYISTQHTPFLTS